MPEPYSLGTNLPTLASPFSCDDVQAEHKISKFEPFGPFEMPKDGPLIDKKREGEFWEQVEKEQGGLPDAVGCYIFAIRAGKGIKPW